MEIQYCIRFSVRQFADEILPYSSNIQFVGARRTIIDFIEHIFWEPRTACLFAWTFWHLYRLADAFSKGEAESKASIQSNESNSQGERDADSLPVQQGLVQKSPQLFQPSFLFGRNFENFFCWVEFWPLKNQLPSYGWDWLSHSRSWGEESRSRYGVLIEVRELNDTVKREKLVYLTLYPIRSETSPEKACSTDKWTYWRDWGREARDDRGTIQGIANERTSIEKAAFAEEGSV